MLCIIDMETLCLYSKCRFYISKACILEQIDREGWPKLDERLKNGEVHEELKEMSIEGPGNIQ